MQGGDLQHALKSPALKWYQNGAWIALDIINGIHFLHTHNVSLFSKPCRVWSATLLYCSLPNHDHIHEGLTLQAWPRFTSWLDLCCILSQAVHSRLLAGSSPKSSRVSHVLTPKSIAPCKTFAASPAPTNLLLHLTWCNWLA